MENFDACLSARSIVCCLAKKIPNPLRVLKLSAVNLLDREDEDDRSYANHLFRRFMSH